MSAADRTKVLEAAQKHLAKGNYDRAIGEFTKIVEADPTDVRTWLKIGDLYTRKGARREAIETYAKVAWQYGEQGFFLKAVAVYKQILKLDPTRVDIQIKLAEMYEMLQLTSDALATYEHVAAGYARGGDIERALATLAKMADLDPENIPVRIKLAEGLSKAGRTKEAGDAFEAGAALLKNQGRIDDFIKVAERLLYHRPSDFALAKELAGLYIERSDPKRALSKLQICFKTDPKDVGTLELLAEAFHQLGQLPKTLSVYREVARIHQDAGRANERARTLKRILELDPGDTEARQGLASQAAAGSSASVRRDIAPPRSAVVEPSRSAVRETEAPELEQVEEEEEVIEEEDEILIVDGEDDEVLEDDVDDVDEDEDEPEETKEAVPSRSVPPEVAREAQIARLLTECDIFMRYGLKQKVIDQLHQVLEMEPMHVGARERLKDVHLSQGEIDEAIGELITLADILSEEKSPAAVLYLKQVLELDPRHPDARLRLTRMGVKSIPPVAVEQEPVSSESQEEVFFVDDSQDERAAQEPDEEELEEVGDSMLLEEDEADAMRSAAVEEPILPPPPIDAPVAPPPRVAMVPPPSSSSLALEKADPLAPMSPREFDEVPLRPSQPEPAIEEPVRHSMPAGDVEELLDEADFFVAQGLFDEARDALTDALRVHPGHPLIEDKLNEVNQLEAVSEEEGETKAAMVADQSFELAEKLAEELDEAEEQTSSGSDVLDVEAVFEQFKKGVEQQVAIEDTETHFDLGIAYKEMGLLDDAMNEFRLCLANPSRICIAQTMIGLCQIEKGDLPEAIVHFKKGLYAETKTDREELGLYFELGNAYELLRDPKEALYYYQKVEKRDATFRDVLRRIQNLAQPQPPPPAPQALGTEDIDRAFDDLMGKD